MDLSNLKPAVGSVKKAKKRLGRGQGSGKGGTSTKGHKGQQARTGYSRKIGFEGGQMPLQRRVPKFGFKNINRVEFPAINLDSIQSLSEKLGVTDISYSVLVDNGLVSKGDFIKVLGRGKLTSKLSIEAHAFSLTAKESIESLSGKVIKLDTFKKKETE